MSSTEDFLPVTSAQLFPNPTHDELNIDYGEIRPELIHIFNTSGQLVIERANDASKVQLSVGHLPKGFYIVRSKIADKWMVQKFVKS